MKNLEIQKRQSTNSLSNWPSEFLSSDTEKNPWDFKAITLRSGNELKNPLLSKTKEETPPPQEHPSSNDEKQGDEQEKV